MYGLVYITDALRLPGSYLTVQIAMLFTDHDYLMCSTTFTEYLPFSKTRYIHRCIK